MSDQIDRAAKVIAATDAAERGYELDAEDVAIGHTIAMSLDAAGLLASAGRNAAVAAEALREAAELREAAQAIADTDGTEWPYGPIIDWLHDRADRIERGRG